MSKLLLLLFLTFPIQAQDSKVLEKVITWAKQENLKDFPAWLKRYPNFIPQAGSSLPDALSKTTANPSLLSQYQDSLQPAFDLFKVNPTIRLLDEQGQILFVVGSKYVGISQGFKQTPPAALRALICQEFVLASLRQALATAKPKEAYELKLRAYFISTIASLALDKDPKALETAINLRYQIDLQMGVPVAREGISQASKKYTVSRAIEWWDGTSVAK